MQWLYTVRLGDEEVATPYPNASSQSLDPNSLTLRMQAAVFSTALKQTFCFAQSKTQKKKYYVRNTTAEIRKQVRKSRHGAKIMMHSNVCLSF